MQTEDVNKTDVTCTLQNWYFKLGWYHLLNEREAIVHCQCLFYLICVCRSVVIIFMGPHQISWCNIYLSFFPGKPAKLSTHPDHVPSIFCNRPARDGVMQRHKRSLLRGKQFVCHIVDIRYLHQKSDRRWICLLDHQPANLETAILRFTLRPSAATLRAGPVKPGPGGYHVTFWLRGAQDYVTLSQC